MENSRIVTKVVQASTAHSAWSTIRTRTAINVFLYGLIVGVVSYALFLLLNHFVFQPILCESASAYALCGQSINYASGTAIVLGSIVGLFLLVRERIYRPILAIIGVCVALWTVLIGVSVSGVPLYASIPIVSILFGVAYIVFSWLVQPTSLYVSLAGVIVVSLLARLSTSL